MEVIKKQKIKMVKYKKTLYTQTQTRPLIKSPAVFKLKNYKAKNLYITQL